MTKKYLTIAGKRVAYYFDTRLSMLKTIADKQQTVILTDENIMAAHGSKWKGWKTIVIKAGEAFKQQGAVDDIIGQLIALEADRKTTLVGIGGGVVTDIAGYVASVYMRGIAVGFVPTSVLGMVDASIGGKNGVDAGIYKNLIGTIRQPDFLLFDTSLLRTLPEDEWKNGFAEIIKHAVIKDSGMFKLLEQHDLTYFRSKPAAMTMLIQRNALLKTKVVQGDPYEAGDRKLLNFGHTIGHAIENDLQLPHGFAVAVGMLHAAHFSQGILGFRHTYRLLQLIEQYGLPTHAAVNPARVMEILKMDKKRVRSVVHFVLLEKIGKAVVKPLELKQIESLLRAQ